MTSFSKQRANPNPGSGDRLRDQAADLLSSIYGTAQIEHRVHGKKADVFFEKHEFGKTSRIYVEAKDYNRPLHRNDLVKILTDYGGILKKNAPAMLLVVTRSGLAADGQEFVQGETSELAHQTIWEIETNLINLDQYLVHLREQLEQSGLDEYYVESGFSVRPSKEVAHRPLEKRTAAFFDQSKSILSQLLDWAVREDDGTPVAVLGGYGSGKTSLATKLAAELAEVAFHSPHERQPVLIRLGGISSYSNIEGLLAGFFTSEFPIPNFNCHNFLNLNQKGRFVVILDGFDEMKHSMSWPDFQAQVRALLKLHGPRSKVLLLGRPSAFLSEMEDRYILKGEKPVGDDWVRLPDWPQFHELVLNDFASYEREQFIKGYLRFATAKVSGFDPVERARTTNRIADSDPELFKKPVHSKILTDLATDPRFDLEKFRGGSSRWVLYKEFLVSIYQREAEKSVRRGISAERRLEFLRDLTFWLWSEKGTQISFQVDQLPNHLFSGLPLIDPDDRSPLCRELLTGSVLERKAGDVFFFGHRSFAEFLVADRMLRNIPSPEDHQMYSEAFVDGVRAFIEDANRPDMVKTWASSLSHAHGVISQGYLDFLAGSWGGVEKLRDQLSESSHWRAILQPFHADLAPSSENFKSVFTSLFQEGPVAFAWHYLWLVQHDADFWRSAARVSGRGSSGFDRTVIQCLLNSLFAQVKNVDRNLFINSEQVGLRRICDACVRMYEHPDGDYFEWSHGELIRACSFELQKSGLGWDHEIDFDSPRIATPVSEATSNWGSVARQNLDIYRKYVRSWKSITERSSPLQKREVSRKTKPIHRKSKRRRGR